MKTFDLDGRIAGWRGPVLAALLTLIAGLPGLLLLPPLDRDESRFAQATSQMLESGDYVDIRYQDEPRWKKPVGIYWMQAIAVGLTSDVEDREIAPYRIPSLLGAMLAAWAVAWAGSAMLGGRVLAVAVHRHHDRRARGQNAGPNRPALARIGPVGQDTQSRQFGHGGLQLGQGRVLGRIVHEDHLVRTAGEGGGDLARQGHGGARLVMDGNDDGDLGRDVRICGGHRRSIDEIDRLGETADGGPVAV